MTTLNINGQRVKVDDSFLSMSPELQQATVEEIAASMGESSGESSRPRTVMDKLTGQRGERFQTWPERMVRSLGNAAKEGIMLPGQVMRGEVPLNDPATGRTSDEVIGRATDMGAIFGIGTPPSFSPAGSFARPMPSGLATEKAAQRLNVDVPRAVTANRATSGTARSLQDVPFVGSPLSKAMEKSTSQIDDAAIAASQRYGSGDVATAGGVLKSSITKTAKEDIPAAVSKRYDAVGSLVDDSIHIPLSSTQGVVRNILLRRQQAALPGAGKAAEMVRDAVTRKQGMNYKGIKDLRTSVGELLDDPRQLAASGMSQGELKQIYAALSDDLKSSVMKAGGKEAQIAFEKANAAAKGAAEMRKILDASIGKGLGKSDENIIAFVQRIAGSNQSANVNVLMRMRAAGGEAWDEVASAVTSKLGRDQRGEFSPTRFVTDYEKLSKTGKRLLFDSTGDGGLRQALDDIAQVSKSFDAYNQGKNFSNTGKVVATVAAGGGAVAAPLTTLSAAITANGTARILAQPRSARAVAAWAKAYEKAAKKPSAAADAALLAKSKTLALMIAGPTPAAAKMIAQLSGGAVKSIADGNGQSPPNGRPVPNGGPNEQSYNQRPFDPLNDA